MSPRSRSLVLRLSVFLLVSSTCAWAQERLGPTTPPVPKVGERARVSWSESSKVEATRTVRGRPPEPMTRETRIDARWTEEVAAVATATGALFEVRLKVERWTRRDAGREDPGLADRALVLRPGQRGDDRVDAVDPPLTPAARAFFARVADRLAASPYDEALRPAQPVAVGETWRPRRLTALVFDADFVDFDEAASEGTCTLRALGERADVRLVARVRLLTVPGTRARVQEGGDYHLAVDARFAPAGRATRGELHETARFEGTARGQLPDGTPFELVTKAELETTIAVE